MFTSARREIARTNGGAMEITKTALRNEGSREAMVAKNVRLDDELVWIRAGVWCTVDICKKGVVKGAVDGGKGDR